MLIFDQVSVRLGGKDILKEVSFALRPHRLTVLVGRNGSGKSTLFGCVNQQIPYTGQILEGEKNLVLLPPKERAKMVAILPQKLPAPHIIGRELVAFGRSPYLDFTGRLTQRDRSAVEEALKLADAQALADRFADTLSGGEFQRLALSMILAQNTPIALLDEPTAHMDLGYEGSFLETLNRLKTEKKKTLLLVLHDLSQAVRYADDLVVLDDGRVVFCGTKEDCLAGNVLETTFGLHRYTAKDENEERIFFAP